MNEMKQCPVQFGTDDCLLGMVTVPAGGRRAPVACVMLNMGANHRVGPHRINVKLAHALAASGMSSLRFDLGGVGDSEAAGSAVDLRTRAVIDLQAGMDVLEDMLGVNRFVIVGMCSGAEHAMATAMVDARVIGLSMFDGFSFPSRRARWERALRRALAAPTHPAFAGKARRWLKRHLPWHREAAMPGFLADEIDRGASQKWFAAAMQKLTERKVAIHLLFSGSLSVCDRDRDQLGSFRREPFARHVQYEFIRQIDHTVCTALGQQLFVKVVGDWVLGIGDTVRRQQQEIDRADRPAHDTASADARAFH